MKHRELSTISAAGDLERSEHFIRVPANCEVVIEDPLQSDEPKLGDYLRRLWQRKWLILIIFLASMACAVFIAMHITPIYTATARLRLGLKTPKVEPFAESTERSSNTPENPVTTQMSIFQSPTIARKVVQELNFYPQESPSGFKARVTGFLQKISGSNQLSGNLPAGDPRSVEARMQMRVAAFLKGLAVAPVPDTQIFEASYSSPDPIFSARALNALCDTYLKEDFESKSKVYAKAQKWLEDKMPEVKDKLAKSEAELYKFTGADGGEYMRLVGDAPEYFKEMDELRANIAIAENDYQARKIDLQKVEAGGFSDNAAKGSGNIVVDQLRAQLAAAEVEYDKLRTSAGPQLASLQAADAARKRLSEQLSAEKKRLLNNAQLDFKQAKAQLDQFKKAYADKQTQFVDLQQRLSNYNILKREVDVNRDMYNNLLQKWREVSVGQSIQPSDVTILQPAEPPLMPLSKIKYRILLAGLVLGLGLGIGLALLLDNLDVSIKNSADVWRTLRLPTLGYIPRCSDLSAFNRKKVHPALIALDFPHSAVAESFRSLRTAFQYAFGDRNTHTILISSPFRNDGKTMVAANLAISFAQKGRKVLLIDADLKNPALHRIFGLKHDIGLGDLLKGNPNPPDDERLQAQMIHSTNVPNLSIIPAGSRISNTADLLDSNRMHNLLTMLSENHELIIIDSAPLLETADTNILAPHVDGILLVVRPGKTPRHALDEACKQLNAIGGHVLGIVMNNPKRNISRAYGMNYNVNYGYQRNGNDYYTHGDQQNSGKIEPSRALSVLSKVDPANRRPSQTDEHAGSINV